MKIIPFTRPTIGNEEKLEALKTLSSDWLTSGRKTLAFEEMLSDYIGCKYVKAVDSCTSALNLAVLSSGIRPKDEVITTAFTFCATVNAVIHAGARPVFADIDKDTFNIDPEEVEKKITKRTKAVLVMHYGGLPCHMGRILSVARKYKLKVIEDAAHAIGAEYEGKKIGDISDISCFSFHAAKNITTGEGGAITTNNKSTMEFIKKLYFHGIDKESWQRHKKGDWKYRVVQPGFKYNMNDICASLGIHQLRKLDKFIDKRSRIVFLYHQAFINSPYLSLQKPDYRVRPAHHLYPIVLNTDCLKITRDEFIEKMIKRGIMPSVHFIPIYKHPAYREFFTKAGIKELKNTEYIYRRILSLPLCPRLSLKDADYIISVINDIIRRYKK